MSLPTAVCAPAYRVATSATDAAASVLFEDWSSLAPVALAAFALAMVQQRVAAKTAHAVPPTAAKALRRPLPIAWFCRHGIWAKTLTDPQ